VDVSHESNLGDFGGGVTVTCRRVRVRTEALAVARARSHWLTGKVRRVLLSSDAIVLSLRMPGPRSSRSSNAEKNVRETDAHVGLRVRSRRIQLKMSQTDLGDAVGITFQQIQKYEKGANRIGSSRLQQIASALGVRPDYFFENQVFENAAEGPEIATFNEFIASSDGVRLMQAFVKIRNKLLQRTIVKLVADLEG